MAQQLAIPAAPLLARCVPPPLVGSFKALCLCVGLTCRYPRGTVPLLPCRRRLQHNQLSGSLPPSWATSLPNLQILSLHQNQLRGPMPYEWLKPGYFQKLEEMYIQNNQVWAEGVLALLADSSSRAAQGVAVQTGLACQAKLFIWLAAVRACLRLLDHVLCNIPLADHW